MKPNVFLLFVFSLISGGIIVSQPTAITWQGKLFDNSGNAINQNNVAMTFAMFDASPGGTQLWPASGVVTKTVNVVQGLFSVQLGTGTGDDIAFTAAMFDGHTPWLEVKVGIETLPRTEITNVPFALISSQLSASAWETPGEIGKTTPNTGKFTSLETEDLKITSGASEGKVLTSDADGDASWMAPSDLESDPIFGAWDKSTGISISENQISNLNRHSLDAFDGTPMDAVYVDKDGYTGIGTTNPTALLSVFGTGTGAGNVLFTGERKTSSGNPPAEGPGTRFMWYPDKAALRAGMVSSTQWDKINIGDQSIALGYNTNASSLCAVAIGASATASAPHAVALGKFTKAQGQHSTAMGYSTEATGNYATSMGSQTKAEGVASTAMGEFTTASGHFSTSMGRYTTAQAYLSVVMGRYNVLSGDITAWVTEDPLFIIGNGSSDVNRSNALTVLKNANTTIGGSLTINWNGTSTSYKFPETRGTSGQFLKTAGDGTTSWSSLNKSDFDLENVENTAISTWAGSSNITTLGTIATGTWHGTALTEAYVGSLSASKITSGTFDNALINWAAPGAIGSTTRSTGAFTALSANNGLSVSAGTVNIKPSGSGGTSGQVLTTDGSGNATWQNASGGSSVTTQLVRFIICVGGFFPSGDMSEHFLGEILLFAGPTGRIPSNFMECKGQQLLISEYSELYTVIGVSYGGNGTTNFNLPNLTGKVPLGM